MWSSGSMCNGLHLSATYWAYWFRMGPALGRKLRRKVTSPFLWRTAIAVVSIAYGWQQDCIENDRIAWLERFQPRPRIKMTELRPNLDLPAFVQGLIQASSRSLSV